MRGLTPSPTKMEDPLLQELLQIMILRLLENLGAVSYNSCRRHCHNGRMWTILWASAFLQFLWSVQTAEESYLDYPYSTHWEDELLLQASQAFSKEQEEEDALLLAASQDYEKQCGPLMTSDGVQSAVVAQVPLNIKRNNNWAANSWQCCIVGWMGEARSEQCYWHGSSNLDTSGHLIAIVHCLLII